MDPLLPQALQAGDAVRLVSPASWFDPQMAARGMQTLENMGMRPALGDNALCRYAQYTAGTPEQRLDDLHAAFCDRNVRAIICNRGGYGSAELLSGLDVALVARNPKIFLGCSDITSVASWIHDSTGLIVFHGPMAAGDFARPNGVDFASWDACLTRASAWELGPESGLSVLRPGAAEGKFYGGCLSMLLASLGTPYEIHCDGTILFLEDVGVKPYQIERMLLQLRLSGKLDRVQGIVFGPMMDCVQPGAPRELLQDVLRRFFHDFPGPIAMGLRSGHVPELNITLPIGAQAQLDLTGTPRLLLSPSVAARSEALS